MHPSLKRSNPYMRLQRIKIDIHLWKMKMLAAFANSLAKLLAFSFLLERQYSTLKRHLLNMCT